MSEAHSEKRKLGRSWNLVQIRKQEEFQKKKYGKFTKVAYQMEVFPIGDDFLSYRSTYYDSVSSKYKKRFKK
ncbi:hypothetical protein TNIN_415551 [Trichonephila inaurata madagascariensis]|uniref:Uncharacterized protein n=1 Tax=Trichonephila inaurata madagascariensis TaxID=2747483 RepID=A0A8X7CLM6_9ARAC|nr:hypothetical protein TNIN_415551 [Trichonephila inaurata madagascariensis]